ncbi:hypothetical protein V6N13_004818 [Hibiscus sabdariffa]
MFVDDQLAPKALGADNSEAIWIHDYLWGYWRLPNFDNAKYSKGPLQTSSLNFGSPEQSTMHQSNYAESILVGPSK